eukprot:4220780-Alexandrium_andersonii.AAC.1
MRQAEACFVWRRPVTPLLVRLLWSRQRSRSIAHSLCAACRHVNPRSTAHPKTDCLPASCSAIPRSATKRLSGRALQDLREPFLEK